MPDDGQQNIDASALQSVVSIIKDMEIKVSFNIKFRKISISSIFLGICCSRTDKHQNTLI